MKTRTVALFGKGELAIKVANYFRHSFSMNYHWKLSHVVPVRPAPTWTSDLGKYVRTFHPQVNVIDSGNYRDLPEPCDLNISIFYDKIFKADWLKKYGSVVNLHGGILPQYRGCKPIPWALKYGERMAGATMHWINSDAIDAGAIISQVQFTMDHQTDEVKDVYQRMLKYAWTLFEDTIERLDTIHAQPQDESKARYFNAKDAAKLGDRSNWTRAESK